MTGIDWDRLTANMVSSRSRRTKPTELERKIVERLVAELTIAEGAGWLLRSSAIYRLLRDNRTQLAVVDTCAEIVGDADNPIFIEPATILETSTHQESARQVLRCITHPISDQAFHAGWLAAAEKISRRHFNAEQLKTLATQAVLLLSDDEAQGACRIAAAALLRLAPKSGSPNRGLLRALRSDDVARSVFEEGRTRPFGQMDVLLSRVVAAAMRMLNRDVLVADPLLHRLLDDLLFHPYISRRLAAAFAIAATPYRIPVATALTIEMKRMSARWDPVLSVPLIQGVGALGSVAHRQVLEAWATAAAAPRSIADAALAALAHMEGQSEDAFWAQVIGKRPASVRAVAYAAGASRNWALLSRLRTTPGQETSVRTWASWWINLPREILDSTADGC